MLLLVVLVTAAILGWAAFSYNRLVRDRNRVRTAWSDIDVQLKRRYDLIPKLVAAVDAYARHERTTLTTLAELRSRTRQIVEVGEKGALEQQLGDALHSLVALAEAYPELQADQNFLQLQSELSDVEDQIQYARRYYNGAVRNLNTRIESFPDLLVARLFRFAAAPFFQLETDVEAHPPRWPAR